MELGYAREQNENSLRSLTRDCTYLSAFTVLVVKRICSLLRLVLVTSLIPLDILKNIINIPESMWGLVVLVVDSTTMLILDSAMEMGQVTRHGIAGRLLRSLV